MALIEIGRCLMSHSSGISDVARKLGIPPRLLSDLFYSRVLDDAVCPVVSGRRLIPDAYVPVIEQVLRDRHRLGDGDRSAKS